MAGTAFLPWEEWLARLLHPLAVTLRRWLYKKQRDRLLARSEGWPQAEGTVFSINWDSSFPREEILYSYSTEQGYFSGSHWRWFDSSDAREVKVGARILLRYSIEDPAESVFLSFH
jgi:hypothetical protein